MPVKQNPVENSMSTATLSWKNKQSLREISTMFKGMGAEKKMSDDECLSFLLREYEKIPLLNEKIAELHKEQNLKCRKALKYVDDIGLQCSFCGKKSGVKFLMDMESMPVLNEFLHDEDLELIRKVKAK